MEVIDFNSCLDSIMEIPMIDEAVYLGFLKPAPEKISIRGADGKQKLLQRLNEETTNE